MPSYLTGVALRIPDEDLARAVARQRLTSVTTDHPVAPLVDCVQMGRGVGLQMSEMQRVTGLARQTLYRQLVTGDTARREPSRLQAGIETLMLIAAEADYTSAALLARRGAISPDLLAEVLRDLDSEGLCTIRRDGYATLEAAPTSATYAALREHFDDLFLRRPDAISVYVRVPDEHRAAVEAAAQAVMAKHDHVVMPQSVAPSVMTGTELSISINAPTIRRALAVAHDIWKDVLEQSGLPFSEPAVTNVIPPGTQPLVPSEVLDAFLDAAVDAGAPNADLLRELRSRFAGGVSEVELAGRCVTQAALALRRTVGNEGQPPPIIDGDAAFAELQPALGVPVGHEGRQVKRATVAALQLAADHLGPLPGGRLGSFRAPGTAPRIVNQVHPTNADTLEMARLSGEALGSAAAAGAMDAASAVRRVVSGVGV